MGGCCCCCSSNSSEVIESPAFLHYAVSEDNELSSNRTTTTVDTNLDTSVPDTYRPPPAPIPYETYGTHTPTSSGNRGSEYKCEVAPGPTNTESVETKVRNSESNNNEETDVELEASIEKEDELKKSSKTVDPPVEDEDDNCPICLEEYDSENPKITTKCDHHYHLACILEWMERSDTCPMCDQEMVFSSVEG